ncbi:MAG: hypothetical protein ACRENC_07140 [Gemmatimonadaceae bacterium]
MITSDRIARTLEMSAGNVYFVHLYDKTDVDAELRAWLRARASRMIAVNSP